MDLRDKLYIDGEWSPSADRNLLTVFGAADGKPLGSVPQGSVADVDRAVAAARAAFEGWAATPLGRRLELLETLHAKLLEHREEIARIITGEVGMPLKLSRAIQAGLPAVTLEETIKLAKEYPFEQQLGNSLIIREAAGVVACITPWNFPLHQLILKLAPALTAGCTAVVKPSEEAPLSAFLLFDLIDACGFPPGVVNLISGPGRPIGEALAAHPAIDMISFTGSTAAGRRISELAAPTIKRVAMELGGKSASILLDDAELEAAVKGTVNSCFLNSGQTCSALTRMLVPETRYAAVVEQTIRVAQTFSVGDPFAGQAKLGPLVSEKQQRRVRDYIQCGIDEGAELLLGGPEIPEDLPCGYYVKPTVFGRVTPDMTIAREEIFGPVLSILSYRDEDEAVNIANDSPYGLSGAVWSRQRSRAERIARRLRTGQVDINGGRFNPLAPFGGYKQSGNGREMGSFGLEEFLELKSLQW